MMHKNLFISGVTLLSAILGMSTHAQAANQTENTIGDVSFSQSDTPLTIDYVSNLHFGSQKISAKDEIYDVILDKDGNQAVANNVKVTDIRGTNAGWKLQVQQDDQFKTTDQAAKALTGAQISLDHMTESTDVDNQAPAPTPGNKLVLVPGDGTTPGALVDVAVAPANTGMGTWTTSFGDNQSGAQSVQLSVPGTSEKVKDTQYTAKLTWVLSDTPA